MTLGLKMLLPSPLPHTDDCAHQLLTGRLCTSTVENAKNRDVHICTRRNYKAHCITIQKRGTMKCEFSENNNQRTQQSETNRSSVIKYTHDSMWKMQKKKNIVRAGKERSLCAAKMRPIAQAWSLHHTLKAQPFLFCKKLCDSLKNALIDASEKC